MLDHWLLLPLASRLVVASYLGVMGLLAIQGLHRYSLLLAARRAPRDRRRRLALTTESPIVTVQLPIFNELFVARRLITAVAALDWPRDRLQIQVLDDSTDETTDVVRGEVTSLRAQGFWIDHLHRADRSGYKAGALAAGLATAAGEFIAIFDADFVPTSELLREIIGEFAAGDVGMVQVRWEHLNRNESLLTEVQALALDGHFLVDHPARAGAGHFFNFNGTAGVWRRRAIDDAGGWQADTLTEDLDLSYRAQLAGWRFVYLADVTAPAELPANINAFKSQQHRWAKGSAQAARKLAPAIVRAALPWRTKVEALLHLTGNFAYPLLLALALLAYPALELRYRYGWQQTLFLDLPFFVLGSLSVILFYAEPIRRLPASGGPRWLLIPALMALGVGMTVNNGRAVIAGLLGHRSEFRRTPKSGNSASVSTRPRYAASAQAWVGLELVLGIAFTGLVVRAATHGLYLSIPFLCLFATGFLTTSLLSIATSLKTAFGRSPIAADATS